MPNGNDSGNTDSNGLTPVRPSRRALLSGAAGGLVALAGCGGGGGDGDGGSDGGDGGDTTTTTTTSGDGGDGDGGETLVFKGVGGNYTKELNYNVWNPQNWSTNLAQGETGFLDQLKVEYVSSELGGPLADWTFSKGDEVEFSLVDGLMWQTGDDYTAEDAVLHLKLFREVFEGAGPWAHADQVMARDDTTFAFNLTVDAGWNVIRSDFFEPMLASPKSLYQQHLEALQDASTDSEFQNAKNELLSREITGEDGTAGSPPPTGFTAWKPSDVTATYIEYELWEEHPFAENINFQRARSVNLQRVKEQGVQMIKSDNLDAMRQPFQQDTLDSFSDDIRVDEKIKLQTTAVLFNNSHPILSDHRVRRGLGYMIDRERMAKVIFPPAPGEVTVPAGIQRNQLDTFLGDAKSEFLTYELDRERGAQLLRDAGLSKSGGQWMGPDGSPIDFKVISPPAKALDRGAKVLSQQFKQIGMGHTLQEKPGSEMWSAVFPQGKMDLVVGPWAFGPHPITSLKTSFINSNPPNISVPEEVSYPSTVGDMSSSEKTANPAEMISEAVSAEESRRKEIITELAWAYNSRLRAYDISQKTFYTIWNTDDWEIEPLDSPGMGVEQVAKFAARNGYVQKK